MSAASTGAPDAHVVAPLATSPLEAEAAEVAHISRAERIKLAAQTGATAIPTASAPVEAAASAAAQPGEAASPPAASAADVASPSPSARAVTKAPIGVPVVLTPALNASQREAIRKRLLLENLRAEKWIAMLKQWEKYAGSAKVKTRCRKGIPDPLRGAAWVRLTGCDRVAAAEAPVYARLLCRPLHRTCTLNAAELGIGAGAGSVAAAPAYRVQSWGSMRALPATAAAATAAPSAAAAAASFPAWVAVPEEGEDDERVAAALDTIERDISRTFPQYPLFSESRGQDALCRVLVAYARGDREVGYTQGMGFLAAMALSYLPEEDAFALLWTVMRDARHHLRGLFLPGLPQLIVLQHVLSGLLAKVLPRLSAHFHAAGIHPTMYASQWFLTMFSYSYPFPFCVRVLDAFLCEGFKAVFRIALAILAANEARLLAARSFEEIMTTFRKLPELTFPDLCSAGPQSPASTSGSASASAGAGAEGGAAAAAAGSEGAGGTDPLFALAFSSKISFKRKDMEALALEAAWLAEGGGQSGPGGPGGRGGPGGGGGGGPRPELCGPTAGQHGHQIPAAFRATPAAQAAVMGMGPVSATL